jgi:hypothetical protein
MDVAELLGPLYSELMGAFERMEIAEDEIEQALKRHNKPLPLRDSDGRVVNVDEMGPIWDSFWRLKPTHERMEYEPVYRQHCAELLDRVADGLDTRAATGAELVSAISEASLLAPLTSSGAGLYLRLMAKYFPELIADTLAEIGREVEDYQKLHGQQMEVDELELRRRLRQDWRQ